MWYVIEMTSLRPQPGPQTIFASSPADIAIFASQPGSGKSFAGCLEVCRWHNEPNYLGVAFRNEAVQLKKGPTSLWGHVKRIGLKTGGRPIESPIPKVAWASGAEVHLNHANTDKSSFDGTEFACSFWDELAHFEFDFWEYVCFQRHRSTSRVKPYIRASVMPTPDHWVRNLAEPWLDHGYAKMNESGKLRWVVFDDLGNPIFFDTPEAASEQCPDRPARSMTFVFALLTDNLELMRLDPEYVKSIQGLRGFERETKLNQNWDARPDTKGMFSRAWFDVLESVPPYVTFSVRAWDRAASLPDPNSEDEKKRDPDWTRGVRLDLLRDGRVVISDVVSTRSRPAQVRELIRATAKQDGPKVLQRFNIDPGSAGLDEEDTLRVELSKVPGCGPVKFAATPRHDRGKAGRAEPVAAAADRSTDPNKPGFAVVRAAWNSAFFSELESFPGGKHDDQVDALSAAYSELPSKGSGFANAFSAGVRSR